MTNNLLTQDDDNIPVIDETRDYFAEYVGEGKKYTDEKALAKAKAHADAHIALLEKKMDAITADYLKAREENVAGAKLQELLDKLENTQAALASRESNPNSNEDQPNTLGPEQVESLVSAKIQQHEQTRREQENYRQVETKLKEKLGTNFKSVLKEQSEALGLSAEDVDLMARKNPNLFFKTFDLNEQPKEIVSALPKSTVSFAPKAAPKHQKWSYYQDLRKKNPTAWLDTKIRIQMEKDSQALGPDFYDI